MDLIIAKVKEGDKNAFAVLINEHKAMAFTLALKLMQNREDAEEVAQDAFVKAYKNINRFEGKSKFSTWLYTIVYNSALTQLRKKKISTVDLDNHSESYNRSFEGSEKGWYSLKREERSTFIKEAMATLSKEDQVVITLFYLNENSTREVSEITGWELPNVKVRLHRARKRLLVALEDILDTEVRSLL